VLFDSIGLLALFGVYAGIIFLGMATYETWGTTVDG